MRCDMRKPAAALAALIFLSLAGCAGGVGHNYRDTESLEVVQALGIDLDGGSVTLSAATGGRGQEV